MHRWGEVSERWCPDAYLKHRYPDVRVYDVELPGRLQACVDHEQRIIWLRAGLTAVERRSALAYEIGQLEQGPTPLDPLCAAAHERAAGDWAARMLIGTDALMDVFACCDSYAAIAECLDVDLPTLRTRLRGLTDAEQDRVLEAIQRRLLESA